MILARIDMASMKKALMDAARVVVADLNWELWINDPKAAQAELDKMSLPKTSVITTTVTTSRI